MSTARVAESCLAEEAQHRPEEGDALVEDAPVLLGVGGDRAPVRHGVEVERRGAGPVAIGRR
jgi:hypothetical protein